MSRTNPFERSPGWLQGAQLAQVVSLDDPSARQRVQVRLVSHDGPPGQDAPLWARVVAPFAGADRGAFFLPDVGDEVLVVFVLGDASQPLILGGLWNGASVPPAQVSGGAPRTKRLRSKNGITITLQDDDGRESLTLETPGGQRLTLQDGPGQATLEDANGNRVVLDAQGITVVASATVAVQASRVEVSAGQVSVQAAMSTFSGVVQCDVLQTNAVISSSYTPGAGNVW